MPTLKQITCVVECGDKNIRLREYQSRFTDGFVSSYVAVPSQPTNFSIHVTSEDYIAPGLAMFVFIDGVAQCNRNRTGLIYPGKKTKKSDTEIDFRVRQKEEKFADGKWLGREWKWESLNIAAADAIVPSQRPDILHAVGTIEVVILRCRIDDSDAPDTKNANAKNDNKKTVTAEKQVRFKVKGSSQDSYMHGALNLDGAGDEKPSKDPYKEWLKQEYKRVNQQKGMSSAAPNMPPGGWPQTFGQSGYPPSMLWQQHSTPEQQAEMARLRAQWFYNMNSAYGPLPFPQQPMGGVIGGGTYHPQKKTSQSGWNAGNDDNSDWDGKASSLASSKKSSKSKKSDKKSSAGWDNNDTTGDWGDEKKQDSGNSGWGDNANQDTTASGGWNDEKKNDGSADTGWNDTPAEDKKNDDSANTGWNDTPANAWNNDNDKKDQNDTWNTTPDANADNSNNNNTDSKQDDNNNNNTTSGWGDNTNQSANNWKTDNGAQTTTPASVEKKPKEPAKRNKKEKKPQATSSPAPAQPVSLKVSKPTDPSRPFVKSYFSSWSQDPATPQQPYLVPEEPLPQVPKCVADDTQASHQTQAGKGVLYSHRTGRPKYIDSMQKPYAVFVFKYRSREKLAQILNVDIDKIKEDKEDIRKKLKDLSREELIEQFMRAKAKAGYDTNSSLDSSESEAEAVVSVAKPSASAGETEDTNDSWGATATDNAWAGGGGDAQPSTGW